MNLRKILPALELAVVWLCLCQALRLLVASLFGVIYDAVFDHSLSFLVVGLDLPLVIPGDANAVDPVKTSSGSALNSLAMNARERIYTVWPRGPTTFRTWLPESTVSDNRRAGVKVQTD